MRVFVPLQIVTGLISSRRWCVVHPIPRCVDPTESPDCVQVPALQCEIFCRALNMTINFYWQILRWSPHNVACLVTSLLTWCSQLRLDTQQIGRGGNPPIETYLIGEAGNYPGS